MNARKEGDRPSACRTSAASFRRTTLAFVAVLYVVGQHAAPIRGMPQTPEPPGQRKSTAPRATAPRAAGTATSQELHRVGETVAKAVLEKNIDTLLAYDRTDLRAHDAESLKNSKSDLYCYIFDSECITWGDGTWRSVYEKLSQAKQLEIKTSLVRSPSDQQLYGSLYFYDAKAISSRDLRSFDFLCKQAPAKVASWRFRLENGKWKAVTPLFDSETLGACPGVPQPEDDEEPLPVPIQPEKPPAKPAEKPLADL